MKILYAACHRFDFQVTGSEIYMQEFYWKIILGM